MKKDDTYANTQGLQQVYLSKLAALKVMTEDFSTLLPWVCDKIGKAKEYLVNTRWEKNVKQKVEILYGFYVQGIFINSAILTLLYPTKSNKIQ